MSTQDSAISIPSSPSASDNSQLSPTLGQEKKARKRKSIMTKRCLDDSGIQEDYNTPPKRGKVQTEDSADSVQSSPSASDNSQLSPTLGQEKEARKSKNVETKTHLVDNQVQKDHSPPSNAEKVQTEKQVTRKKQKQDGLDASSGWTEADNDGMLDQLVCLFAKLIL
ncbi:uncharacterized protein LOC134253275 [Saccostrea cucullata]|uniref:uncharacterized protein LOC134253275 n=1 Tax=Saccostrea cuccullata TaxID=36930 RepID=UPI002ED09314